MSVFLYNICMHYLIDVDECHGSDLNDCDDDNGECNNTDGGYTCHCASGSIGDGFTCTGKEM